ncbi:MAG: carbonic anhydrase [Dehalococcoidales bacterium]|nr:carbonic anhydrase [Dehalococcoidales bacterium]
MKELLASNVIYADNADKLVLKELNEKGQKPIATVIACSDSRVPVEIIFNQLTPGILFVIRVAGNIVADPSVTGSIEYAVEHLKTPYVIVLGHTKCGAITAYLEGATGGEVGKLLKQVHLHSREINEAVIENVAVQVKNVMGLSSVKEALNSREIEIYGMIYDLESGIIKPININGENMPSSVNK